MTAGETRPPTPAGNGSGREMSPFAGTALGKGWRWLDERYQLDDVIHFVRHKELPVGGHAMIWYYFGGVSLFFFVVQIVTGILLLMYYEAGEGTSYESMKYIVGKVPFGWLIRSIHCWSAHLMVLAVLVHMFSVFFLRSYRKPRELTWFTGLGLLGIVLTFGFSGYLLPWNELSFFATAVGTDTLKSVPLVGTWLLEVLRGGEEVSIRTVHRFFALHVCALPIATFALIAFHLVLVQRQGMAPPEHVDPAGATKLGAMRFFPNFALRDALLWVIGMNALAILAVWLPHGPGIPGMEWELGEKADPLKPAYPGIKPEWYFLWIYQLLKEFPPHIAGLEGPQACMLVVSVLISVWLFVPFLNRRAQREQASPGFTDFGIATILFLVFLTLKAWDFGVHAPPGEDPWASPDLAQRINRNSAAAVVLLGLVVTGLRLVLHRSRHLVYTAAVLLQAVLHGFVGVSYLAASGVCIPLLAVGLFLGARWRARLAGAAGALAIALVPFASAAEPAAAAHAAGVEQIPESSWPASFKALFDASLSGAPVVSAESKTSFRQLPGHAQTLFFAAVDAGLLSSPGQLNTLLSLELDDRKTELLLSDNCVLCHTNPDMQVEETLFRVPVADEQRSGPGAHLDLREVVADVHFRKGLMCAGCHGGAPSDQEMVDEIRRRWPTADVRKTDRTWIPEFCTVRCHADPGFMQRFNPSLPVDQMLKYRQSRHGRLLFGLKDSKAAQCVSCHGVHGIRGKDSPLSTVHPPNIPATCGRCHADARYMAGYTLADGKTPIPTDQIESYRRSVHGRALFGKRDLGAPVCNDCHGNHAALPPDVNQVAQVCRTCHVVNGTLFDGSRHKQAFERNGWPECETCHGKHEIGPASDAMMAVGKPTNLCDPCHAKYGKPSCFETSAFFYQSLVTLRSAHAEIERGAAELAEFGMEVDDLRFGAASIQDAVTQARSLVHSFNRTDFSRPFESGIRTAQQLRADIAAFRREYTQRRSWLIVSTLLITIFAVLLYARIKIADRQGGYRRPQK